MVIKDLRGKAANWFIKFLLILIIISFGLWGVQGYFMGGGKRDAVATVGGTHITKYYLKQQLQKTLQQMKSDIPFAKALEMGLAKIVLEDIINELLIEKEIESLKLTVGQKTIDNAIKAEPAFREEGQGFSPEKLKHFLQHSGMKEKQLVHQIQLQLMQQQLLASITAQGPIPRTVAIALFEGLTQTRDVGIVKIAAEGLKVETPTEEQLQAFYDSHQERFLTDEKRRFSYLRLSPLKLAKNKIPTAKELQETYELHISEFTTPEKRQIVIINLDKEGVYEKAKKAIAKGQTHPSFVDLGYITPNDIDPVLAKVAFSLNKGELSKPLGKEGDKKAIYVKNIRSQAVAPLKQVKNKVMTLYRQEEGRKSLTDLMTKLEDEIASGTDLDTLAKDYNISVHHSDLHTQQAFNNGRIEKAIVDQAFQQNDKEEGQFIDMENGEVFLVNVTEVVPAQMPKLGDIKEKVKKAYQHDARLKKAMTYAKEMAENYQKKPRSLKALVNDFGHYHYQNLRNQSRVDLVEKEKIPQAFAQEIFATSLKSALTYPTDNGALVAIISGIKTPPFNKNPKDYTTFKKALKQAITTEQYKLFMAYLREKFEVSIDEEKLASLSEGE